MKTLEKDIYEQGAQAHLGVRKAEQTPLLISVLASIVVAIAPMVLSFLVFAWTGVYPTLVPALLLVGSLTLMTVVGGTRLWERHHLSSIFSFGDLMLWNWVARHRAEARLVRNTQLLGFDRAGRYQGDAIAQEPSERLELLAEIADALDAKSSYTVDHTDRVERLARDMGEALGLSDEHLKKLSTAAFLHDIGNIRIPEHILRKQEELTEDDKKTVESHALLGAMMAYEVVSRDVADGILHHHERWDGNGYPNGKTGAEIPIYARIIAVAEAYDAMTSTRPHRQSGSPTGAVETLELEAGAAFDPLVVEALKVVIPKPLAVFDKMPTLAALRPRLREWMLLVRRVGKVALSSAVTTATIALILGSPGVAS
ncbi:MAG: HD domain-containing protein [Actinomycetota bacterium]|nr:HD domain-containing protein [Actinomycetota bacterium]